MVEDGDGGSNVRRSGRKRKEISYAGLSGDTEGAADEIPPAASPASSHSPSESVSSSPEPSTPSTVYISDSPPRASRRGVRPRKDMSATVEDSHESTGINFSSKKRADQYLSTKDGRLTSIAGTSTAVRKALKERLDNWKDVISGVPEELVDFSIGWGVCTGDWQGEGGSGQRFTVLNDEYSSIYTSNN